MTKISPDLDSLFEWYSAQTKRQDLLCKAGFDKGEVCSVLDRVDNFKFDLIAKSQRAKYINKTIGILRKMAEGADKSATEVIESIIHFLKNK